MIKLIKGIDVSKHQGTIDWRAVAQDGVEFAMVRAGYGMYQKQKDPCFDQNVHCAQQAGILCGAYHYSYAQSQEDARREAEVFLSWIQPHNLEYPVAFDIEDNTQTGLSSELLTCIVETFCEAVEQAGYRVMVYSNKYWLQHKLIYDRIKRWDIWLAHYVTATDYDKPYTMWQCSSNAQIQGIRGNCDLNWAYKDYVQSEPDQPDDPTNHIQSPGVCTGNGVRVRSYPDAHDNTNIVRALNKGNQVSVLGQLGDWYVVHADEHYGYVSTQYIDTNSIVGIWEQGICTGDGVRVRTQPDTQSKILRQLNTGNTVDILDRIGDWFAVRAGDHIGFVFAQYIC